MDETSIKPYNMVNDKLRIKKFIKSEFKLINK